MAGQAMIETMKTVGPFGLPWAMYRETMAGVREVES